jgi:hypothetical protein
MMVLLKFELDLFGLLTPMCHCLVIAYLWFVVDTRLLVSASHVFPRFPRSQMGRGKTKRRSRVKTQLRLQNVFDQRDIGVKPPA